MTPRTDFMARLSILLVLAGKTRSKHRAAGPSSQENVPP
jgi:hypothetical protein